MILVDTSVWVDYFRGASREIIAHIHKLLDEDQAALAMPVRIELLGGSSKKDLPKLRRALSGLPVLTPGRSSWELVETWVDIAVFEGERFGVSDLLIGALATERGFQVWSLDSDFGRMQKLGFAQLYLPPS
jgi:predicted nucleic acid-binding protein